MSTITQDIDVRYIPGKSAELKFTVKDAETEHDVYLALAGSELVGSSFNGLVRKDITVEAEHVDTQNPEQNIWRATVQFLSGLDEDDNIVSFDTTGGSQHVTQSLKTVGVYPSGSPDMYGAIGYDGQRVNGVDIITPSYTFTEQHVFTKSQVDDAYRTTLANLTGCVNNYKFRGFAAGEVLFKGAVGTMVVDEGEMKWQVQFNFAASPNRSGFYVGDIYVKEKLGWDYLWVIYADEVDSNQLIKRPRNVYIERLYDSGSFSNLEI